MTYEEWKKSLESNDKMKRDKPKKKKKAKKK